MNFADMVRQGNWTFVSVDRSSARELALLEEQVRAGTLSDETCLAQLRTIGNVVLVNKKDITVDKSNSDEGLCREKITIRKGAQVLMLVRPLQP